MSVYAEGIMGAVAILVFLICAWGVICSSRACSQRLYILDKLHEAATAMIVAGSPDYLRPYDEFGQVSYDAHFMRLFTFRDPFAVYPYFVRNLLDKPSVQK